MSDRYIGISSAGYPTGEPDADHMASLAAFNQWKTREAPQFSYEGILPPSAAEVVIEGLVLDAESQRIQSLRKKFEAGVHSEQTGFMATLQQRITDAQTHSGLPVASFDFSVCVQGGITETEVLTFVDMAAYRNEVGLKIEPALASELDCNEAAHLKGVLAPFSRLVQTRIARAFWKERSEYTTDMAYAIEFDCRSLERMCAIIAGIDPDAVLRDQIEQELAYAAEAPMARYILELNKPN